jgi:hypothetical protein
MDATPARTIARRWVRRFGLASSIALLVALGAAGCSSSDDSSKASDTTTTSTTAASQSGGSAQGGGSQSGGSQSGGTQSGGGGPTGPTPTIVSFTGTEDGTVDCHNGNQQNFSDHWQTTDAVRVSITEGGGNLPPSGDGSLPFNCLNGPHTFTLTAYGSGGLTATKSITLTPRNVQQPQTSDAT